MGKSSLHSPKLLIGIGIFREIAPIIQSYKSEKVLVVVGEKSKISIAVQRKILKIRRQVKQVDLYEIPPDLKLQNDSFLLPIEKYDTFIGIGHRKTLQFIKMIAFKSINLEHFSNKRHVFKHLKKYKFILIPTAISTGEEFNININKLHKRNTFEPDLKTNFPDVTIIYDSTITMKTPSHIIASTTIDSLSHAFETYFTFEKNTTSHQLAKKAIQLFLPNLIPSIYNRNNISARDALVRAGFMASISFQNIDDSFVHSLTTPLENLHKISHAVASAILLPYIVYVFNKQNTQNLSLMNRNVLNPSYILQTLGAIGFPTKLSSVNIRRSHVETIVQQWEKNEFKKYMFNKDNVKQIYEQAILGTLENTSL